MQSLKIASVCALVATTIFAFQNCGRAFTSASSRSSSASSASDGLANAPKFAVVGNALSSLSGQQIQFVADDQTPLGTLSLTNLSGEGGGDGSDGGGSEGGGGDGSTGDGASLVVKLYNARSGRSAILQLNYDPQSYAFKGLTVLGGQPFMCHDSTASPCMPGFINLESGQPEVNCASPIYFTGALSGSIQDITVGAWQYNNCQ